MTNDFLAGVYRIFSLNSSANHTPVLLAVSQRGTLDDPVYVRVSLYNATYCILTQHSLVYSSS